jgi:hypothetical protein
VGHDRRLDGEIHDHGPGCVHDSDRFGPLEDICYPASNEYRLLC